MAFEIIAPFVILFVLYAIRTPVAFAMLISGSVGIYLNADATSVLGYLGTSPYRHSASFLLTTIPMFILMAEFLSNGRLVRELFAAAAAWLGRFKAGLAMATVVANAGFAALSGSSTAAAASMGRVTVPEMRKYKYSERLSIGAVAAAGTFASMIPPSTGLIIYGVLTETSISQLFIAGVIPGALTVLAYLVYLWIWAKRDPSAAPPADPVPVRRALRLSVKVWPPLLLVIIMVFAIYTGIMTATEAGAVGAVLALVISVAAGGLRKSGILDSLKNTLETTGAIIFLIIGGAVFGGFLTLSQVTQNIITWVIDANLNTYLVIAGIVLLYLILGMFMDMIVLLTLTLPLTFPLAMQLGFDPIWFGILVIKLGEIGLITPPFGLNVFVATKAAKGDITHGFAGAARFLFAEGFVLVMIIAFPFLATWLPSTIS